MRKTLLFLIILIFAGNLCAQIPLNKNYTIQVITHYDTSFKQFYLIENRDTIYKKDVNIHQSVGWVFGPRPGCYKLAIKAKENKNYFYRLTDNETNRVVQSGYITNDTPVAFCFFERTRIVQHGDIFGEEYLLPIPQNIQNNTNRITTYMDVLNRWKINR